VHLADVGVDSSAPDLPGAGADSTPRAGIVLDDYIAAAVRLVDRIDDDVTIVAHSIAGLTAPAVAVARPEKVSHVVLLAALVTRTGERGIDSIPEDRRPSYFELATASGENAFRPAFDTAWERFFPSLSESRAREEYEQLTPQPLGPYLQPSPAGVDALERLEVRRSYVLLNEDRTFVPDQAREFAARAGCHPIERAGDHCWMLTEPNACAREIAELARSR
jgi:pimeloyl-ACP methyl ester carboxylesterase